ncbi:unnamed protein product [Arctogadus glacialis]
MLVYSHPRHYCLRGRTTSQPCLYPEAVFSAPESPLNRTTCSGYNVPVLFLRFKHLGSTTPTSKAAHDHTLCQLLQKPARIATLRRVLVMFRSRFPPSPPPAIFFILFVRLNRFVIFKPVLFVGAGDFVVCAPHVRHYFCRYTGLPTLSDHPNRYHSPTIYGSLNQCNLIYFTIFI